jgi:HlyD family secretion protein
MKTLLKVVIGLVVLGAVAFGAVRVAGNGKDKKAPFTLVRVERGTITDKALATGQIVPTQEIQVKSQISGIVKQCFVEVGQQISVGDPLFTITPDPTPMELNGAERAIDVAEVSFAKARADHERTKALYAEGIVSKELLDASQKSHDEAALQLDMARERLALTKEGKLSRAGSRMDSVIRAPAAGTMLKRHVNPGDPVVPLTSYQAGTPLATMADMSTLLFRGTVDEIDVGKLREGMPVRIRIGALPDAEVTGRLDRIAPKATEKEGTTLFDVEASITSGAGVTLRAGYSATADVVVQEKRDILTIPERLIAFEKSKAWIELPPATPDGQPEKREITVGLSDGLSIEVLSGLTEGQEVVQRPPKEIQ